MNVFTTTDLWHFCKDKKKEATMKKDITFSVCVCVCVCVRVFLCVSVTV